MSDDTTPNEDDDLDFPGALDGETKKAEADEEAETVRAQEDADALVAKIKDAIDRTKDDAGALFEPDVVEALYKVHSSNKPAYMKIRASVLVDCKGIVPIGLLEKSIEEFAAAAPKVESVITTSHSFASAVQRLNKEYAHVIVGGKARIAKKLRDGTYEFWMVDAFHSHFKDDRLDLTVDGKQKSVSVADVWSTYEHRNKFEGVAFAPGGAPDGTLNLWRGFTVNPIESLSVFQSGLRVRRFLSHVKYNVCQGNQVHFRCFIQWVAHMFQKPEEKPEFAVSIVGKKGSGKTKVAKVIAALLGIHAVTVSSQRHLVGNFNAHLAHALFVFADEAFWAGDKTAEGALLALITDKTMSLEKKGLDVIAVASFIRLLFAANPPGWVFPATSDERRLFALTCGEKHLKDYAYFSAIDDQLYGDGKERYVAGEDKPPAGLRALLTFFMKLDLTGFNPRAAPETDALKYQRVASLQSHEQFMLDCLNNRTIGKHDRSDDMNYVPEPSPWIEEESHILKIDLYNEYVHSNAARGRKRLIADNMFGQWILKTLEWKTYREKNKTGTSEKKLKPGYYWVVPEYSRARKEFIEKMKVRVTDDDGE